MCLYHAHPSLALQQLTDHQIRCYIGHRRLHRAITHHTSLHPSDTFTIRYHPFQLNPDAPKTGIPKREYYAAKFGADKVDAIFARMDAVGAEEGIRFNNDAKTGNTVDSHRVIEFAGMKYGEEVQGRVVEALFRAYFEEGADVTNHQALKEAAMKGGLDAEELDKVLKSDEQGDVVRREAEEARKNGISGVPYSVINDMFAVEGAQEPRAFEQLFEKITQKSKV